MTVRSATVARAVRSTGRLFAVVVTLLLVAVPVLAQDGGQPRRSVEYVETPPTDMMFDRVDDAAGVWRLDRHVRTSTSETPAAPRAVYVQFGFMSCGPCHVLADLARHQLADDVELVYVHLDDIEMGTDLDPTPTWDRLRVFLDERSEYDGFTGLIRGNSRMMRLLTGPGNPPHALLVHPDGRHVVLRSPTQDEARTVFTEFLSSLSSP